MRDAAVDELSRSSGAELTKRRSKDPEHAAQALSHLTLQARANIIHADKLYYLVTDLVIERYLQDLNASAESLVSAYESGKYRMRSYEEMVERVLAPVREGLHVCAAFYGHPGVFVFPSHEAIRRARSEGYSAEMLPAISAEDCLFADLGVDPAIPGCQSYEATDFLVSGREFDPRSSLVIWQIGVIGHLTFEGEGYDFLPGLEVLRDYLLNTYPPEHVVVVYEAAHLPTGQCRREAVSLAELVSVRVTPISTLYVPPREVGEPNEDMLAKLGIPKESLSRVVRRVLLHSDATGVS